MRNPIPARDWDRIARKLWGSEVFDDQGNFYLKSSDEEIEILRTYVRELQGRVGFSRTQWLQLELIRAAGFNFFDAKRVVHDLLERRGLWEAVLMDRPGNAFDLVKLRDLPEDHWNVDTLYVLAHSEGCARELAELSEPWRADRVEVYGAERTQRALGSSAAEGRVVAWWWD